ncbi:MAG: DMT family transporter [Rhodospirillales bacterium]|nr:DMT family transporter [Rhodospirillales bacterium]MCW8951337.1 DMT family transporter [Rhodospirillales bacterium]MCW8970531.1 DMT family transporter [Rhodospirillales bacterium]MCW9002318.1 DMT family transporter [Rhodospirillales bacterium]MCW9040739.1 DMT family transporter [Rhodospirillales bacterium]
MPAVFVLLWSTGFIGAKLGLPYAEPLTFLSIRFVILTVILLALCLITKAPWPRTMAEAGHIAIAGLLVQATYLGGVFSAIHHGIPAGVAALIVGVQPLLTAVAAGPYLGEKITARQWVGFFLGMAGVILVVAGKLSFDASHINGVILAVLALIGITLGTLYQKRHGGGMDLRSGSAIQFGVSAIAMIMLAPFFETMNVQWTGEFIFAMAWLVLVLSLGAISLLFMLIKRGAASQVASLFYLVPPVTAVVAYFVFGETMGWLPIMGMAVAVLGVALVVKK